MTPLQRAAVARTPLTDESVEALYKSFNVHGYATMDAGELRKLCESHERLRNELEGRRHD